MTDTGRFDAKIRPLTQAELDRLTWEFGHAPFCRSRGCVERAHWACSVDMSPQRVQLPNEYCDRHAREFAIEHGLDPNFQRG